MDPELVKRLVRASRDVMRNAFCPYSHFPVGAALLCQDGSIYTGIGAMGQLPKHFLTFFSTDFTRLQHRDCHFAGHLRGAVCLREGHL